LTFDPKSVQDQDATRSSRVPNLTTLILSVCDLLYGKTYIVKYIHRHTLDAPADLGDYTGLIEFNSHWLKALKGMSSHATDLVSMRNILLLEQLKCLSCVSLVKPRNLTFRVVTVRVFDRC